MPKLGTVLFRIALSLALFATEAWGHEDPNQSNNQAEDYTARPENVRKFSFKKFLDLRTIRVVRTPSRRFVEQKIRQESLTPRGLLHLTGSLSEDSH